MKCIKAQSQITPFINDQLDLQETEEFIDHVLSCSECREELEVYYAILTAMRQLDEDKNLSDDYNQELANKLEKAQEKIIHAKYTYYRKKGAFIILVILIAFLVNLTYKEQFKGNPVSKSTFRLRKMYGEERYEEIDLMLQKYFDLEID